jgi:hypothetical protein
MREHDDAGRLVLSAADICDCCGGALGDHTHDCASRAMDTEEVDALAASVAEETSWILLADPAEIQAVAQAERLISSFLADRTGGLL